MNLLQAQISKINIIKRWMAMYISRTTFVAKINNIESSVSTLITKRVIPPIQGAFIY